MSILLRAEGIFLVNNREHQRRHRQEQGDEGQYQKVPRRGPKVGELRGTSGI